MDGDDKRVPALPGAGQQEAEEEHQRPLLIPAMPMQADAVPVQGLLVTDGYGGYGTVSDEVVVLQQPPAVMQILRENLLSRVPTTGQCPFCNHSITTSTKLVPGLGTWLSAGGLCLVGCWAGCCLIPFCVDDLKDVNHTCPQCHRHLGTKNVIQTR